MYVPLLAHTLNIVTFLAVQPGDVVLFVKCVELKAPGAILTVSTIEYCITLLLLYISYCILINALSTKDLLSCAWLRQYEVALTDPASTVALTLISLLGVTGVVPSFLQLTKKVVARIKVVRAVLMSINFHLRYIVRMVSARGIVRCNNILREAIFLPLYAKKVSIP